VNVVVAAARGDHRHFGVARPWLEALVGSGDAFSIPDAVAGAFVRIVTSRRVFPEPSPIEDAFAYLRALRGQRGHLLLAPGPTHLELLERLCRDADATGDLVPDAQIAALALEHGAEVVSFDRDFARFEGLRWSRP
jgi:toxin-antitoxin system PIN domain toxin